MSDTTNPAAAADYDWTITEKRQAQLDLDNKRLVLNHSMTLHRDSQSIRDIRQMLDVLTNAGAPEDATISVDAHTGHHIRVHARWNEDVR